jgi:hypothetical protein
VTIEEKVARALAEDLLKNPRDGGNHGCLIPHSAELDCFIIKGHVDLYSLAGAVLAAIELMSEAE